MSAKLMGMVFEAGPAEATQRFVLLAIADNCDHSGFAFPGVALLAAKSCQTERNVLRILQTLEAGGWLMIKRRSWGGKKRGNSYQLNLARLRKAAERPNAEAKPGSGDTAFSSGDKMSVRELREVNSIGFVEPSGDRLSCEQSAVQNHLRGDIAPPHEVTNASSRGDKSDFPIRKNHQEPSGGTITPQPPLQGGVHILSCDASRDNKTDRDERGCLACADAAVAKVQRECAWTNPRMGKVILRAMQTEASSDDTPVNWNTMAEGLIASYKAFAKAGPDGLLLRPPGPRKFVEDGLWLNDSLWPYDKQVLRDLSRRRHL